MQLSAQSAKNYHMLTATVIVLYLFISVVSVRSHDRHNQYKHVSLRAVALLRKAARASLRSSKSIDAVDKYADALEALNYVNAVSQLLSSHEIARLTGINIDELQSLMDTAVRDAATLLADSCSK